MSGRHCTKHISGSILTGQDRLPRLPVSVPDGSTRDGSYGPGHLEARMIKKIGPLREPCPASHPARVRYACLPGAILGPPLPVSLDCSIIAQRHPSACGYVTSSQVFRQSRAQPQPICQSDLFCIFHVSFRYVTVPTRRS